MNVYSVRKVLLKVILYLSMLIYAVALLPLVKSLKAKENRLQTWYQLALVTSRRFAHGMISWLSKAQRMDTFLSPRKAV